MRTASALNSGVNLRRCRFCFLGLIDTSFIMPQLEGCWVSTKLGEAHTYITAHSLGNPGRDPTSMLSRDPLNVEESYFSAQPRSRPIRIATDLVRASHADYLTT